MDEGTEGSLFCLEFIKVTVQCSANFHTSSIVAESQPRSLSRRRPRRTTRKETLSHRKSETAARERTRRKSPARRALTVGSRQSSRTLERSASPPAVFSLGKFHLSRAGSQATHCNFIAGEPEEQLVLAENQGAGGVPTAAQI